MCKLRWGQGWRGGGGGRGWGAEVDVVEIKVCDEEMVTFQFSLGAVREG